MNSPRIIDVQDFINRCRFSPYQWIMLVLCLLIVMIDGFDTAVIGYIAPSLIHEWNMTKHMMGSLMSAALFGLAFGSLFAGPLADHFGRKPILILSVFFFGFWSLVAAKASSIESLTILRFLTGVGLGASMSNALTLISEYAPDRCRALLVNSVFCGFPIGAALGGFLAGWLIPNFGWRIILVVGGLIPLILVLLLIFLLPESIRYMVARGKSVDKISSTLSQVTRTVVNNVSAFIFNEYKSTDTKSALQNILSREYILGSAMLWITYFMGLLIFYVLISWMPLLMEDSGFSIRRSVLLTSLFPLGGGIGTIMAGWLMDRVNPNKVVALAYLLTGAILFTLGHVRDIIFLSVLIFLAGTAMNSAQSSMGAIAAVFYPTHCRATGVSWMIGLGRFGGVFGALIGVEFMNLNLGFSNIFMLLAVPALIAAIALTIKNYSEAKKRLIGIILSK